MAVPKRILIVDDDPTLSEMYRARFVAEGFVAQAASDGQKGLALATEAKPDVVLLDLRMPNITGLEVLEILKTTKALKDIPVIVLTALGDDQLKKDALERGAADYLTKADTTPAEVVQKVHGVLA